VLPPQKKRSERDKQSFLARQSLNRSRSEIELVLVLVLVLGSLLPWAGHLCGFARYPRNGREAPLRTEPLPTGALPLNPMLKTELGSQSLYLVHQGHHQLDTGQI
jgi:hypothetical protein